MIETSFNIRRFISACGYIFDHLKNNDGTINYMKMIKLIFLADRYHLRNYGFLISSDTYVAMKNGTLGSGARDVFTFNDRFLNSLTSEERDLVYSAIEVKSKYKVVIHTKPAGLSASAIEALNFVIEQFGKYDQFQLGDITHDYPEWKRYEEYLSINPKKSKPVHLEDIFEDPDVTNRPHLDRYLHGNDPFNDDIEYITLRKEEFSASSECY